MRWHVLAISICAVLVVVTLWLIIREIGGRIDRFTGGGGTPAESKRDIAETFREYLTAVRGAKGDQLLVAEVQAVNELAISDQRREFWTGMSLGTSTARIRYPVTYRYYILLSDRWRLALDGGTLWVVRPVIRPLEPAIDTAGIEFTGENGWLRWNKDELKDRLLAELTPHAVVRANANAETARPHADSAITAFIRAWLLAASGAAPRDARVALCDAIPAGLQAVDIRVSAVAQDAPQR